MDDETPILPGGCGNWVIVVAVAVILAFFGGMAAREAMGETDETPDGVCGSINRPMTDPSCECMDYAVSVPRAGWGLAACRPDQVGTLTQPSTVNGWAALSCRCVGR